MNNTKENLAMRFVKTKSLLGGAGIGTLGGLIGLGGAEFRLPFLVGVLRIDTLHAIIINLLISLVTVSFALIFRGVDERVVAEIPIVLNLLAGTLLGAWMGANYASRINKAKLQKLIFILLVFLSFVLLSHVFFAFEQGLDLGVWLQVLLGFVLGIGIGMISSLLGVAGGELLIPVIVLLYGVDIKLAGTLSLAISFPTLLIGIYKYHKNRRLQEVYVFKDILVFMAIGSIIGAFIGSLLVGIVSSVMLEVGLGVILLLSAYKIFKKDR